MKCSDVFQHSRSAWAIALMLIVPGAHAFAGGASSVQSLAELEQQLTADLVAIQQEEQLIKQRLSALSSNGSTATGALGTATATSSGTGTSTTTTPSPITDVQGNVWAITPQGTITVNGLPAAYSAEVVKLVNVGGVIYQGTSFGGWWAWDGTGWVGVSGDPTQGPVTVTTIADAQGQNYSLSSSGAVLINGTAAANGANAVKVVDQGGTVYTEDANGNWSAWNGQTSQAVTNSQTISALAAGSCAAMSGCLSNGPATTTATAVPTPAPATGVTATTTTPGTAGTVPTTTTIPTTTSGNQTGSSNTGSTTITGATPTAGTTTLTNTGTTGSSGTAEATGAGGTTTGTASTATPTLSATGTTVGTATTCVASASASGTTDPSASYLTDCEGNVWTLAGGQPEMNQNPAGAITSAASLLLEYNGNMYMQDSSGTWWLWSTGDTGWIQLTGDPRTNAAAAGGIGSVANGACGSSNNQIMTTAPTTNLCSTGSASTVTGSGPWNWDCIGSNGGTASACEASPPGGSCSGSSASSGTAPAPAAAVGYTTQTFGPAVTIGQNWFDENWGVDPNAVNATQNSDGSVTVAGGGDTWGGQLTTVAQTSTGWQGEAFGGGGYFEATLSWTGNYEPYVESWPAWWGDSEETTVAGHTAVPSWVEPDFMEYWSNTDYSGTLHDWTNGGQNNAMVSSGGINLPAGDSPSVPHTYGFLLVPSTATTQGYAQWFLNGQQVGQTVTWSPGGPYSGLDTQHTELFLGSSPYNPMTVYNVQVWQASCANDIVQ